MSEPRRLVILEGPPRPRQTTCSGALFEIDRATYRAMERAGVRWSTRSDDVPAEGRGPARVECEAEEHSITRGNTRYGYGLCAACAAMEFEARRTLAAKRGGATSNVVPLPRSANSSWGRR